LHLPHLYCLVYIERQCICHTWANQAITCGQLLALNNMKQSFSCFYLDASLHEQTHFHTTPLWCLLHPKFCGQPILLLQLEMLTFMNGNYIDSTRFLNSWTLEETWSCKTNLQYLLYSPFPTIVRFCPKLDVGSGHPIKQKDTLKWWGSWEHYK